jgi:hypothetical protein
MTICGMQEVNDFLGIIIFVRVLIVIVSDLALGRNQFANVNSSGLCEFFEEVSEIL